MNQILFNKKNNKLKYIFKVQLIISIVIIFIISVSVIEKYKKAEKLEKISKIINNNIKLSYVYKSKENLNDSSYFGKIYIEKINVDYVIFNKYNQDLLKIAPCKFYGTNLGEPGNIAIAGHNYNDDSFFSRFDELYLKDEILLTDLNSKEYKYIIYDIFEAEEDDFSVLIQKKEYDLTLLTCNNANKKRIIVKAYMKKD